MSSAPPPFTPPAPARRKSLSPVAIIVIIFGVLCIGGIAAISILLGKVIKEGLPFAGCMVNFQDVRDAIGDYAKEHDGKLPNAASWQDEVAPYYEKVVAHAGDRGPFKSMPVGGDWGCPKDKTGMSFNSDLSGKSLKEFKTPDMVIVVYEVPEVKRNASAPYKTRSKEGSPTIMGEQRGWIRIPLQGDALIDESVKFNMNKGSK